MLTHLTPNFLIASPEPKFLNVLEPLLAGRGGRVHIALSAEAALALLTTKENLDLLLLDATLPGFDLRQFVAAHVHSGLKRVPTVLISDTISEEMLERLAEGAIDDIVSSSLEPGFWKVRIGNVLRMQRTAGELDLLRESTALNAQFDRLTGVYNREILLGMLFRETDRVQRMKGSLSVILFDVDDFGHWNSRLGATACDELLRSIVTRTTRLLRSYDLLGRMGKDEFMVAMPGCTSENAVMLAERMRTEVFGNAFRIAGEAVRLSACFGISISNGRSPLVMLREAEQALSLSRSSGADSIECFGDFAGPDPAPVTFFSPVTGDRLLAW